jgi:hypothetical protein
MGKKAQEGAGDAPLTPGPRGGETGPTADFTRSQQPVHIMMSDVLADAQADKLREKLKEMAGQLAELQGIAAHKNGLLEAMEREKAELVRRLRVGGGGAGDADADMVTREEFDELQGEADSLKMQLIECLEEQSLKVIPPPFPSTCGVSLIACQPPLRSCLARSTERRCGGALAPGARDRRYAQGHGEVPSQVSGV